MLRIGWVGVVAALTLSTTVFGCRSARQSTSLSAVTRPVPSKPIQKIEEPDATIDANLVQVRAEVSGDEGRPQDEPTVQLVPVLSDSVLELDALISSVLAINPSLQAAIAAWSAAVERYPQAVALEDPMFQSMFAPATFSSTSPTQSSYYIGAAQRIPWHGKRELRGEVARWEAVAASWTSEEAKQRLMAATRLAYFEDYLVHREIELNERNIGVMQDFRESAKAKYEANQVTQQDVSAADLELAKLEQKRLELRQMKLSITARINTLLHRRPESELPPPVKKLAIYEQLPDLITAREAAWSHRPELSNLSAKMQAEQNALLLACKEYYPDFEVMGRYDAFWTNAVQRSQVGMNMNIPLNHSRRAAAVREAQFRLTKLKAEYDQQCDAIAEEVQVAVSRVETNRDAVALFERRILDAAETNLNSAIAAYEAGRIDFIRLMDARKQYIEQQIEYQKTLTEFHRSFAELERAIASPVGPQQPTLAVSGTSDSVDN